MQFGNSKRDPDTDLQLDLTNVITSRMDANVHDGQKRYGTLTKMPNYPKPKTMFYVYFDCNGEYGEDLSKYVIEVTKPNVSISSTKMNQYNRIKYVIENVEYGDLKITFMDVKDDPIEQAFFSYLKTISKDFTKYTKNFQTPDNIREYGKESWGLTTNSNEKYIRTITIIEAYYDKIIAYTIENPVLSSIDFGSNKIGDYSPNNITVSFKVEGITNELTIDNKNYSLEALGETIANIGGANLAHKIGKRWDYDNLGTAGKQVNNSYTINHPHVDSWIETLDYDRQLLESYNKLAKAKTETDRNDALESLMDYLSYPNKGDYFWIKGSGNTSYGIRTPRNRTFFMSGLNKVTNLFDF